MAPPGSKGALDKEMTGMTAARPEPLFHWFIPIDGDGARLGTMHGPSSHRISTI